MARKKKPTFQFVYTDANDCGHAVYKSTEWTTDLRGAWLAAEGIVNSTGGGIGCPKLVPFIPAPGSTIREFMYDYANPEAGWQVTEVISF